MSCSPPSLWTCSFVCPASSSTSRGPALQHLLVWMWAPPTDCHGILHKSQLQATLFSVIIWMVVLSSISPDRLYVLKYSIYLGFPAGSVGKESACNVGDLGLITGLGRSPGGGHGNTVQYSCLENPHGQRSLVVYSLRCRKESDD